MAKKEHEHDHKKDHNQKEQEMMFAQQLMQQQISEIENQINQIEAKKTDLQVVFDSISDLQKERGSEILVPIGSGVLAKAKLEDEKNFLVNVGANIVVKKTAKETQDAVKQQMDELDKAKDMFMKELEKFMM